MAVWIAKYRAGLKCIMQEHHLSVCPQTTVHEARKTKPAEKEHTTNRAYCLNLFTALISFFIIFRFNVMHISFFMYMPTSSSRSALLCIARQRLYSALRDSGNGS